MKKIFNKKVYATGIVCCVAAAAVYTGLSYDAPEKKPNVAVSPSKNSSVNREPQNQPVTVNKNATAKGNTTTEPENPKFDETAKTNETKKEEVASNDTGNIVTPTPPQAVEPVEEEITETMADDGSLIWPVTGEIVMDYNIATGVYDSTLNQYRTNEYLSIGADVGESVKASADGTVEFVGVDAERGNMVIIDHNNGWKTTYCQLQDGVSVKEGQNVSKGQAIGKVDEATIYSTMLGSHLDFKVTKADELVDPKVALAN